MGVRLAILVVLSSLAAVLTNALRRDALPWRIDPQQSLNPGERPGLLAEGGLTLEEIGRHLRNGSARFVDARKAAMFEAGHLRGAINLPSVALNDHLDVIFSELTPDDLIIIYCEGGECEASNEVFAFLAENGFPVESLKIFKPGWEILQTHSDWSAKGREP